MEPDLQSFSTARECLVLKMKATHSSVRLTEVPGYARLQREMHDALRVQHPEWIEADGSSPTCDSYESRFAELLVSHRTKSWQASAPDMLTRETRPFPNSQEAEIVLT
jgi:hypothetical protein